MISWIGFPFYKRVRILDALRAIGWISGNWDPLKGTRRLPCVDIFGSGRDNFIGIRTVSFQNSHVIFLSPVDICCLPVLVLFIAEANICLLRRQVDIPPRRGRDQPLWAPVEEEEVILTWHTPTPQEKP